MARRLRLLPDSASPHEPRSVDPSKIAFVSLAAVANQQDRFKELCHRGISKFNGRRGDAARQPPISINPRISENALEARLKPLRVAGPGDGVGLLLDGFRGYQLLRRGPRDGIADEP